ncbi:enoyl-CoA hydratase [Azorhizobium oxalatiphilum]|uniref:3-hydroxyisobutyryl-CoA hydrolase n=1 Tax=Azorhizobium oxalatiphilum TaxID=980631 RepID=A0A917C8E0_9HYPH|nr:enoyl-CoA hydratase/isomerase family protein [Azorhizobium oxalatiphilum]GGF73511.1 enoyl-CoA hydratase [Azorhizobium oxalatiphilum]
MTTEPEVLFERRGEAGIITLNRPKALNALTQGMVRVIDPQLRAWATDGAVTRIILKAVGEKAFCAGGDVRQLYDLGLAGRQAESLAFWREEYVLNHLIGTYPKPFVSLIDGICMGGGFGLSAHGTYRVGGDRYLFAMPEVNIGLFPDVGGTHVLPRLPNAAGVYLAFSGNRIRTADGLHVGLLTHAVPSSGMAALEEALCAGGDVAATLATHAADPGPAPLKARAAFIAEVFVGADVATVLARLDAKAAQEGADGDFARELRTALNAKSPTSLHIAAEQMKRGPALDLAGALKAEFRAVTRVAHGRDFYEGVRAQLVDKDNAPRWTPAALNDIDPAVIAAHFDPIPDELEFPAPPA